MLIPLPRRHLKKRFTLRIPREAGFRNRMTERRHAMAEFCSGGRVASKLSGLRLAILSEGVSGYRNPYIIQLYRYITVLGYPNSGLG